MLAKVTLVGNLGRKPEVKDANGKRFARFSVAVNKYVNKEKSTMWVDCVCWDEKKVDILDAYADKGTKVYVEGTLEKRTYTKDGVEKLAVEVSIGRFSGELQLLSRAESDGSDSRPKQIVGRDIDDDMPF